MRFPPHDAPSSGAQGLVGYEIDLTDPNGLARIFLDMRDAHLNRNQTLHGGIHAMMLDAAAGFAASRYLAKSTPQLVPVVTLSLSTSYIASATKGRVTAEGVVSGGGFKIIYASAKLRDAAGNICSAAEGVFKRAKG